MLISGVRSVFSVGIAILVAARSGGVPPRSMLPPVCPRLEPLHPACDFIVVLAVTTYKRKWQLKATLAANLLTALPWRQTVKWVIADLNDPDSDEESDRLAEWIGMKARISLTLDQLRYFRRRAPGHDRFIGWHASVAKNSAFAAALQAVGDHSRGIIVNVDNDNFITAAFLQDLLAKAPKMLRLDSNAVPEVCGCFYRHPSVGSTTGRIACSMYAFQRVGGYLEEMAPSGYQDIMLMRCLGKLGHTTRVWGTFVGTAVRNGAEPAGKKTFWKARL